MPDSPDSPVAAIAKALVDALDRAVGASLASMHSLRTAVRGYTLHQKSRGVPLDQVMVALSAVLMQAEDDRASDGAADHRDPELARQLRAWCSEDYAARGSGGAAADGDMS
jgi:hypothetical protein